MRMDIQPTWNRGWSNRVEMGIDQDRGGDRVYRDAVEMGSIVKRCN